MLRGVGVVEALRVLVCYGEEELADGGWAFVIYVDGRVELAPGFRCWTRGGVVGCGFGSCELRGCGTGNWGLGFEVPGYVYFHGLFKFGVHGLRGCGGLVGFGRIEVEILFARILSLM